MGINIEKIASMADLGLRVLFTGKEVWQQLAEPSALEKFITESKEFTLFKWALIIASVFVLFALCLSSYLLFDHLSSYNVPEEQKWLIGIILMVPVYTITSFASLCYSNFSIYFRIMGDCYEAFALYSFGSYLIACLGGEESAVSTLAKQGAEETSLDKEPGPHEVVHPAPLRWVTHTWILGRHFYDSAKFGIVQYMIIKVLCAWSAFFLNIFDLYGEGEFDFHYGYPYITIIQNFSQMWALYCLVQFYHVTRDTLQEINPLAKFLCFKAVVFVTWWQGVLIALLFASGIARKWLPGHPSEAQTDMLQTNLQDFIICIEMAIAAVAHHYIYPAVPYRRESKHNLNKVDSVAEELEEDIEVVATSVRESAKDVFMAGGEHVIEDVKLTVAQAVEPVESGFTDINEAIQDNVHKMNDKLHDNVQTLHENIHETMHKWGHMKREEVHKEGEYLVSRDEKDDDEIVQTEQHVRVERDIDDNESPGSTSSPRQLSEAQPGVVKDEVSATTTTRSANEDIPGEETISFTQQRESSDTSQKKQTSSETEQVDDQGRIQKSESVDVSEKYEINRLGGVSSKETTAHTVERNQVGQVVNEKTVEDREQLDESGNVLRRNVKRDGEDEQVEDNTQHRTSPFGG